MKNNKKVLPRVLSLIKPYKLQIFLVLLFSIISVSLTLYTPILIGEGIDLIIGKGQVNFNRLQMILIILAIITGIIAIAQWLMSLVANYITYHVVQDIRKIAFIHLEKVPISYIDANQPGDIMSRIVTDVDQFSDGFLLGFTQLFTGIITIIGTLGFMLFINVSITLIVVIITPLSLFVANFIAKRTYSMFQQQSIIRGEVTTLVEELVGNQKVVQAFSYEDEGQTRFDNINKRLQACSIRAIFFSSITNPATRFVNGLVYAGVGIFGAFICISGAITIGQLTSFLNYANQYTKPFNEISQVMTEFQNALACASRIFEFIDTPLELADDSDAVILETVDGQVDLENVAFSYVPNVKLLEDINLNVKPGQRVAIVGPTGSGKTTIINLLMRFYEIDNGVIKISGQPINKITRDSLRAQFGMVLQETWLQSASIRDNIAYGNPNASKKEIIEAAKAAYAHGFIKRMPNGYDTIISDDGSILSQGQKQLLCIARVMLTKPPILILDEATSSIDTRTEIRVQKAFQKLMEGRTSFVVAHRLSTVQEADIILVMNNGNIVEQGNHEELLNKNGLYKSIYESQFTTT